MYRNMYLQHIKILLHVFLINIHSEEQTTLSLGNQLNVYIIHTKKVSLYNGRQLVGGWVGGWEWLHGYDSESSLHNNVVTILKCIFPTLFPYTLKESIFNHIHIIVDRS